MASIGVIGGGAWGTALAGVARANGHDVTLWAREAEVAEAINAEHRNPLFLPEGALDPGLRATTDLAEAARAEVLLLVAPAQHLRAVCSELAPHLAAGVPLVICAKGIEQESCALMSEVVAEVVPEAPLAVLSGPTFAIEVAQGLPTAVTLAAADRALGAHLVELIGSPTFRPYLGADLVGAQVGGAVKNVLAIACGIVEGRRLGENARAALTTRGLAELLRLGAAKGALPETLMGLSGLGDLVLTCNSDLSRNCSLGIALGEGATLDEVLAARNSVAEGVATAPAVTLLASKLGVEMPISLAVDGIVNHHASIDATIETLLARPFTTESG
jgi:glycerol-3-phosphate dehydrogenase (NAD(P)+)